MYYVCHTCNIHVTHLVVYETILIKMYMSVFQCLAAGSSIMNREVESASMRPLAKALTRHLDYLRSLLRDQCLKNINAYTVRVSRINRLSPCPCCN